MNLLREEALMQSRDFGVEFAENGYRFYVYDYQQLRWILPLGDNLLAARELVEPVNVDLRVEDRTRQDAADLMDQFEVLAARVIDGRDAVAREKFEHRVERNSQWVDAGHDAFAIGDLDEAELCPERAFTDEFGIEAEPIG